MRIGLAEVGRIGAFHASALAVLPDVRVVVTDAVPEAAARLPEEQGDELSPDLDHLLDHVDEIGTAA